MNNTKKYYAINKSTGYIASFDSLNELMIFIRELSDDWKRVEIKENYEDYEEPKEHYFITEYGEVFSLNEYKGLNNVANPEDYKAIGNYFETKEEAEKAVEKLKAWKRLKDKGFRFTDYDYTTYKGKGCGQVFFNDVVDNINEIKADLDLLFGGENGRN